MPIRCNSQITLGALAVQVEATGTSAMRNLSVQFGDGYRERRPDGINTLMRNWSISTPPMPIDDVLALEDELRALGVESFAWAPPGETTLRQWELEPAQWQRSYAAGHLASVSFSLRLVQG